MSGRLLKVESWELLARTADYRPARIARLCDVSLRHLERHFAEHFGKTPTRWSRELRLEAAVRLIAGGYSNKEVVATLKYGNEAHLCHEFKKYFGVSPQSFATKGRILPQQATMSRLDKHL